MTNGNGAGGSGEQASLAMVQWREELVSRALRAVFFAAILPIIGGSYYMVIRGTPGLIVAYAVAYILVGVAAFWREAPYFFKAGVILLLLFGMSVMLLSTSGLSGDGRIYLIVLPFMTLLLFGQRAGVIALVLCAITLTIFGVLFSTGVMAIPVEQQASTGKSAAWISNSLTFIMIGVFLFACQVYLLNQLYTAFSQGRTLADRLEARRQQAEQDAQQMSSRAQRMRWVADFGQTVISIRRREELTVQVVRELAEAFDVYQVNLFLTDRQGDTLSLVATAGELGEALAETGWQIPVGGNQLPGRVAQIGREQMTLLIPGELSQFPESRVEVCIPLAVRGELLGVLDLHSSEDAFTEDELLIIRVAAEYAATTLDVLKIIADSEAQAQEMRALYVQYTEASWGTFLEDEAVESHVIGEIARDELQSFAALAMQQQRVQAARLEGDQGYALVIPLIARGVPLGYLAFSRTLDKGAWDEASIGFIQAAAERLALAMDNTRLLVQAQQKVFYEEQLGRINDLVWGNPSADVIMEQSVQELGRFLEASEVSLHLVTNGETNGGDDVHG